MVHQAEESPGLAFFWKQEIKGRSWIGRSQKVSASGVCHKCGQVMEEKSFCKHQRMRHRPALNHGKHCVDDIKGQREAGDSYRKWNLIYQCVSLQLPLVSKYSHVQFKSVYVYVYAYHMCVYIDIISVQGENLYQKGIIMHFACKCSFVMQRDSSLFCSQEKNIPRLQKQWQMGFDKKLQHSIFCYHRRLSLMFPNSADGVPLIFRGNKPHLVSDIKKTICCF